jgi:prepilin-type processing-associated H-X9-DG protein
MDGSQCNFSRSLTWPGRTLPSLTHPADDVLIWEAKDTLWNDGASFPTEAGVTDHHKGGGNVGCLDGHVEWWSPGQYTYEASLGSVAQRGGRLYW